MKKYPACFMLLLLVGIKANAQSTIIKLNSIRDADSIDNIQFAYPEFQDGRVIFLNGGVTPGKLNYNRATDEILFKDKNSVLALNKHETMNKIAIGTDTFLVSPIGGFVRQIASYSNITLVKKSILKFLDRERKTAYGGYSTTAGTRSIITLPGSSEPSIRTTVDENLTFTLTEKYHLLIPKVGILEASEKAFLISYPSYKKDLKTYFANNKVNFDNKEELNKLILFAQSLK